MANSVDLDEVAHNEPPHQDLRCLQIQLFVSLVVKELICNHLQCINSLTKLFTKESLSRLVGTKSRIQIFFADKM